MRTFLFSLLLLTVPAAHAGVQSETIFFLQPDGRNYLIERSIHSNSPTHRFHLEKHIRLQDIRHISPARFEWDDSDAQVNSLVFEAGGFTIIYPDRFDDDELERDREGVLHYKSWDGQRDQDGRYGYWYAPGQFDRFSYTWIVPDNIEMLRYRANQKGAWSRRDNAISFYAEQVNNLTFEMSYRVTTTGPASKPEKAPVETVKQPVLQRQTSEPRIFDGPFNESSSSTDTDEDGIRDASDLCPGTPQGALIDKVGCPLDTDRDGVPDGVDQCNATADDIPVDAAGCPAGAR
jgi:hypothetical protein